MIKSSLCDHLVNLLCATSQANKQALSGGSSAVYAASLNINHRKAKEIETGRCYAEVKTYTRVVLKQHNLRNSQVSSAF